MTEFSFGNYIFVQSQRDLKRRRKRRSAKSLTVLFCYNIHLLVTFVTAVCLFFSSQIEMAEEQV